MGFPLLLASSSEIRARLLRQAGLTFEVVPARIDEESLRASFGREGVSPRDQADALAEMKARKVAGKAPEALVLGADQILVCDGLVYGKPASLDQARQHLGALQGQRHSLFSAVVLYEQTRPVWRHVAEVRLTMRAMTPEQIDSYLLRTWDSIRHSVGGYKIEEEGIRLFTRIDGDYFATLGLPLLPLLTYLSDRGLIDP